MSDQHTADVRVPVATYRLQLNYIFGFKDAKKIVRYLRDLGISDIYSAPYFKTKEGSLSGYDIVDQNDLNPEVGTEEEFREFVAELKLHGMGQILDIVPNHMCIDSKDNARWMDVLENGMSSKYSDFFDVDWEPADIRMRYKVLLPFLGTPYGKALESSELKLHFSEGEFYVSYHDNVFPIMPKTYSSVLEYRIDDLKNILPPESREYQELLSIISDLRYLPSSIDSGLERVAKRYREKEILKRRLRDLCAKYPTVQDFIAQNVEMFNGVPGKPGSFDMLDKLLEGQNYRLAFWQVASDENNYRRFFDINNLVAIRMEDIDVFRETHELVFRLIREGVVTGLRIDHADGLYNPLEYLYRLQKGCFIQLGLGALVVRTDTDCYGLGEAETEFDLAQRYEEIVMSDRGFKPFYIIVEKILTKGEEVPQDWPVFGETGYNFLNLVNGIFVTTKNVKMFDTIYKRFARSEGNFQSTVYEKKKLIMRTVLSGEMNTIGHHLHEISERIRQARDFTRNSLTKAIIEVIACLPVYRSYVNSPNIQDRDRHYIELALSKAKRRIPDVAGSVFDFLNDVLLQKFPENLSDEDKRKWLKFVMRFQQFSGPVMAKGVEDTAFYSYNRLVSLNEVGGAPERFGTSLETFHGHNFERAKSWPHTLNATATHDTKRGEDVRARINVLSEIPVQWKEHIMQWRRYAKKLKKIVGSEPVPDSNDEYMLYQTLIGAWPALEMDKDGYEIFKGRIMEYARKAAREAKVNTSWRSPNTDYEEGLLSFISAILENTPGNLFLKDFREFQKNISRFGMYNSLSQTLLKITSPGVPDFYQGTELWDFRLVDPDNRRPVDYGTRINMLAEIKGREAVECPLKIIAELMDKWQDGRIKMFLIYKALQFRGAIRQIFDKGEYVTMEAKGQKAGNVCAFARRSQSMAVLVITPRFLTELSPMTEQSQFVEKAWADTHVVIPFHEVGTKYRNVFTGEYTNVKKLDGQRGLRLAEIFRHFPVALLSTT